MTLTTDSGVATITLNRPTKLNALTTAMLEELRTHLHTVSHDTTVRAVVVRGEGASFSAGADITEWADPGPTLAAERSTVGTRVFTQLAELRAPSIAVVHGIAAGGGLELALACDFQIGVRGARVGFPEARLGNLPAWGGIPRLIDSVGLVHARALLLTGDLVDVDYAQQIGLLSHVADSADVDDAVAHLVDSITACDPVTQALIKSVCQTWASRHPVEPSLASYAALLDSSRNRKLDFLNRRR